MFERSWQVALITGNAQGSVTYIEPLGVPDSENELYLEAWWAHRNIGTSSSAGTFQDASAIIFRDEVSATEANQRIAQDGLFDALMVVPSNAVGHIRIDPDIRMLTVFFDITPRFGNQYLQVRILGAGGR